MPIDTRLDGRPDQVAATARWLHDQLAFEVNSSAASLRSAHADATEGWNGAAGAVFQARMTTNSERARNLHAGIESASTGLTRYAEHLAEAQDHMRRAREIAAGAALRVDGTVIHEPGTAPATGAGLDDPTTAATHRRQQEAYHLAQAEAQKGRTAMGVGDAIVKNMWDDVRQKYHLMVGDFVNGGVYGGMMAKRVADLSEAAELAKKSSTDLATEYRKTPGGTPKSQALNNAAFAKHLEAQKLDVKATNIARRAGSRIPLIGLGVTAAGIGYDITHGKPATKAIISGIGGAGVAVLVGAGIGTVLGGPVGTVVGATLGAAAGTAVSAVLDVAYDHRDEINRAIGTAHQVAFETIGDGVDTVNKTIGAANQAAAAAVGEVNEALGNGAKKVLNAIF
ncbi:hypothetical protein GCM10010112_21910 [Actinoplanes lobatus]|uniref:Uncharacterized protein YukE n=1 Tax=Actinoplanes lobatus TaxID=113568 RepID=A0A7W7HPU3_9ACTN|nr:hypothetical protein [Actinoplanes lobatus]MBB4754445.1 uncharacterized protein YukE [Actinoplanes lobatus]GGN63056.1 hypothetical protein GCM10010112_21910 [Actinoplanes lobatus]GIE40475.1 hypothetical protein Alo02nite_33730 [Actinoplanes lobatus]